jgi:Domain of unknown function (DUF4389)
MSDGEGWQPDPTGPEGAGVPAPEDAGPPAPEGAGPPAPEVADPALTTAPVPAAVPPGGPPPDVPPPPTWPPSVGGYPVRLDVETPERIARWRPLVQWILAIPLVIVLYLLRILAQLCAVIGWFVALFTGQLPEALGDFIAAYYRYAWRTYSYAWFLREEYPPFAPALGYTDPADDPAHFDVQRGEGLSRLAVLFRIILIIPQAVVLFFLGIALYVAVLIAFFAVVITGRWPAGLRHFVVGVTRWALRVDAWFLLLADPYPPFSLD